MMPDRLPASARDAFLAAVERRCSGDPVSYITGSREFYGRSFHVDHRVLVPRPETEHLVETAIARLDERMEDEQAADLHLHDACTGSGCVAITVAAERPSVRVSASDLSEDALSVARANASRLALAEPSVGRIVFSRSDLLTPPPDPCAIITANPPYLTDSEYGALLQAGSPEPRLALAAGRDGMHAIRGLIRDAADVLVAGGWLIMEIGSDQAVQTVNEFDRMGYQRTSVVRDLAGHDRVVAGQRW